VKGRTRVDEQLLTGGFPVVVAVEDYQIALLNDDIVGGGGNGLTAPACRIAPWTTASAVAGDFRCKSGYWPVSRGQQDQDRQPNEAANVSA
jgi:hypothetical protein